MKANELMVGDWVRPTRLNKPARIEEVSRLLNRVIVITADGYESAHILECNPIPLTPEILEKNGFDFIKNDNTKSVWNGWWIYEGLELATACLDKEGNWPCFINIYDSNIECEYVYQLQHALRLCGIEKEIEL